ncbi:hypothetical protein Rfer_4395 (plasmid) [Rhodoferax ferrireducens T118]|uniref:Uncharacterized protein n=1 Tax=Albidiferax ferrireducens (strain ATCC BAA-621 / DSM 15236 / T118) TaxID=338969 RepID=Q21Q64_ALBFT|nr:hypothetical protein [Rhodoferax ferrireducens]ABD72081.1 hypothetical protein Rfer_4395 [Rhodoferax ferrireducens T118]
MKRSNFKSKQAGFMNALIMFGIALIVAMMGAWAVANRSSNTNSSTEQNKMSASVILKEASDFRDGFARALSDGISPSTITFDMTAGTGLLQPSKGYASPQTAPIRAMDAAGTAANFVWNYTKLVKIKDIGADTSNDYMVTLGDLSLEVCQRLNNMLYNTDMATVPVTGVGTLADYTTTPAAVDLTTSVAGRDGKTDLCVKTSDGKYVYYKVMVEN